MTTDVTEIIAAISNALGIAYNKAIDLYPSVVKMNIVYNIQLKTTTANKQSVFAEKVSAIRTFIQQFIKYTPRQKGEKLFDFLLTSVSNRNDFNNAPQDTINDIIYNELQKKLNKNVVLKI